MATPLISHHDEDSLSQIEGITQCVHIVEDLRKQLTIMNFAKLAAETCQAKNVFELSNESRKRTVYRVTYLIQCFVCADLLRHAGDLKEIINRSIEFVVLQILRLRPKAYRRGRTACSQPFNDFKVQGDRGWELDDVHEENGRWTPGWLRARCHGGRFHATRQRIRTRHHALDSNQ